MKNPIRKTALVKINDIATYIPVRRDNGASTYCLKERTRLDGPWEFGTKPLKRNDKDDWEQVWKLAKEGKVEEIPADIRVRHYANLKKIGKDYLF